MSQKYPESLFQYPITPYLDEICNMLKNSPSRFLILTAETAAGKSTVLPVALLKNFTGKIVMTEPRRLAVLGVANRVAELCKEEDVAEDPVGYKIHLENKITKSTRLEVVTEAILVRQLQNDPALEDYNLVVLDEFHERSVNTDLALAFLKEAMQLRDDLFVVIMSATMDTTKLKKYLSESDGETEKDRVPLISIPGRQFPVKYFYEPGKTIVSAVRQAMKLGEGNILVFLPGISDIRKANEALLETGDFDSDSECEVCVLHSSISLEEQKRIISDRKEKSDKKEKRRIILSSAIAETSLTVPGVTVVIDSGLARINRIDLNTGMEKLTTEIESEFSAAQRAGRAGRLCAGNCIRLWDEKDPRAKELLPEILRADLMPLVLECSERGVYSADGIDWFDKPGSAAWKTSKKLLQQIGMLRQDGHLTEKGRAALVTGVHPRLASIAIESFDFEKKKLSEEGKAILLKYNNYPKGMADRFISDLERRLGTFNFTEKLDSIDKDFLILEGFPDRLAKKVSSAGVEPAEYQFASGHKALLYGIAPSWLVAPEVVTGKSESVIYEFTQLNEAKIEEFLRKNSEIRQICTFTQGTLQKIEEKCFGAFVLSSKKLPVNKEDYAEAWINEIEEKGLECLPLDEKIKSFLLRAELVNSINKKADLYERLVENARDWLLPFMNGENRLDSKTLYDALYWYLEGSEIDRLAPEFLVLENGRKCKVKYEKQSEIRPVIEIIIQRIFGCFTTPVICGKKVLMRLLSPASRPLQVTDDLENFWNGAWVEICKEMKGRYPKHNWDMRKTEENL